jgi:hypothetical protein
MGKLNIKGGTPIGSVTLCKTCTSAHIITGYRESEMIAICTDVHPNLVLPFTVHECTGYYDKGRPSWDQMQKLALHITPAPLKTAGFKLGLGFDQTAIKVAVEDEVEDDD